MDPRGRDPAKPEETHYDEGAAEAGERKAAVFFDSGPWRVAGFGALEDEVVVEKNCAGNAGAYADGEER